MKPEEWRKVESIVEHGSRNAGELAQALKDGGFRFSASDLKAFGALMARRDGRYSDFFSAPAWLTEVFLALADGHAYDTMCDPWAGIGLLIGAMQETVRARTVLALVPNTSQGSLGQVLVPDVQWHIGRPVELLSSEAKEIDLAVSLLPWNARVLDPLTIRCTGGDDVTVKGDVGEQVLALASKRLSATGMGLFVVAQSFFASSSSVFRQFTALGLGVEAALALPSETFPPHTDMPSYLIIVRNHATSDLFVAQLSSDVKSNREVLSNFASHEEGSSLELGRFVDSLSFRGLDQIRQHERIKEAERLFGGSAVSLKELASAINLGRGRNDFQFGRQEDAVYVPLIGMSDVVESLDGLTLKPQNYAQIVMRSGVADVEFLARFLNSEFGREIRRLSKSGTVIPKLTKKTLMELPIILPSVQVQQAVVDVEEHIAVQRNTLLGLQNELAQFERDLWANPQSAGAVGQRVSVLSKKLSGGPLEYAVAGLDQWIETVPFPLASILRAWQATSTSNFKTKCEHLLHFFEATAEFVSMILMSAFSSNGPLFEQHLQKLTRAMREQGLGFKMATFGTWKCSVEYFGARTRDLLGGEGRNGSLFAEVFSDLPVSLLKALSNVELVPVLSRTNKIRNDWRHGGVLGQEEARRLHEQLLGDVQKLRECMADAWTGTQLIRSLSCVMRNGVYDNDVAVLMGSNSEFLQASKATSTCLDTELIYLVSEGSPRALQLLPLMQIGPSPESAKNACYFYNRLDKDKRNARFVSYHFVEQPERSTPSSGLTALDDLWKENGVDAGADT
ncbi:restriction endonuclease subunit S [Candidatus Cryosericum septentrionale]|uniref:Restriction endonuclease subunit S n=1 Tax=Candidatus Cryosericum septentrionale TaxID=2290913 RepID=A0A398DW27_9BACT|nr:restriction endonuclease subunit S [Candidatus Cryosericum septentrionale]RIE16107.1 restriction endonuclease subunit S [Candidatus Cryosericum septentrionale]